MTQTIAQNLIILNNSKHRKTNYNKHPIEVFSDIDDQVTSNNTYIDIINKINKLDINYNNTIDDLNNLISAARQVYTTLKQEQQLLSLIDLYTYTIPNKTSFIAQLNTINTLIEDCNKIVNNILNNTVSRVYTYINPLILDDISSNVNALISKQWLTNYLITLPLIPKIRPINAALICDSSGQVKWQQE